jgi:hypothetical protein
LTRLEALLLELLAPLPLPIEAAPPLKELSWDTIELYEALEM